MDTPLPEVLTTAQVADALHASPSAVVGWANSGKLPHFRTLGGHRRFRRHDVQTLIDEATKTAPVEAAS